jgi:hypothetical protein
MRVDAAPNNGLILVRMVHGNSIFRGSESKYLHSASLEIISALHKKPKIT